MYTDSLFNAFARSYAARSETDMLIAEYLESCRGDPMRYANAAERLLFAVMAGRAGEVRMRSGFCAAIVLTTPPFPYDRKAIEEPVGLPVIL